MGLSALLKDTEFAAGVALRRPFNCLVQLTNRCNMTCSFCDFWPNVASRHEELTLADYERLSDELSELGCFLLSIEGGEPFVRRDLVEIVRTFARHHLPILFTNGWSVTAENARALFDAGLAQASVSIDYPDAARHDVKRGLEGALDRAWRAVDHFASAAPRGGRQAHVMTVLMEDNWQLFEPLLVQSREHGVGHQATVLSTAGYRRGRTGDDKPPPPHAAQELTALWDRYEHLRFFREYFERMGDYLGGGAMPTCRAGVQAFNIDHVGDVSPCIERIDLVYGNVRREPLRAIHARMSAAREAVAGCQDCWTACRGMAQAIGNGGTLRAWQQLTTRMRTS